MTEQERIEELVNEYFFSPFDEPDYENPKTIGDFKKEMLKILLDEKEYRMICGSREINERHALLPKETKDEGHQTR